MSKRAIRKRRHRPEYVGYDNERVALWPIRMVDREVLAAEYPKRELEPLA